MGAILLALATRSVTPGPLDTTAALVSLVVSLAGTSGVGFWAHRIERARVRRALEELASATPVAGIH
jgi:hypothetical protein